MVCVDCGHIHSDADKVELFDLSIKILSKADHLKMLERETVLHRPYIEIHFAFLLDMCVLFTFLSHNIMV